MPEVKNIARLSVEDRLDIAELVAKFAHYSDYGDYERLSAIYVDDVISMKAGRLEAYSGRDAQVAHARDSAEWTGGKNRHYYYNMLVEGAGDEATISSMFSNVNAGNQLHSAKFVVTGRQIDRVRRTADGWKIAARHVEFDQDY